jgi:dihydrofolate synthase / folylpolyglutamate synthase
LNYQQTLDYLFSQLPMFTRIGAAAFKKDLHNTLAFCRLLGEPQNRFKSVHIAGTNGKGSTSHMLAAVLQQAGYKTGLYTSPHLKDFRERIRINGAMIPEQFVIGFVERYQEDSEAIQPSFFEWTVALCFHYFATEKVEIAIIETGLGGRLDSTNVISPELSVITNIGWDHMDMLGDTLEKIAYEKAGIIKPGIPVVIGEYIPESRAAFKSVSDRNKSRMHLAQEEVALSNMYSDNASFTCDVHVQGELFIEQLVCDLTGIYQQHNIKTVICSLLQLMEKGYRIDAGHIRKGLAAVKQTTGLAGRWQVLQQNPLMIADTGHNVDGIAYVLEQIGRQRFDKLHFVIGMVKDKDISKVLKMLPRHAVYYFTQAGIPRALPAQELADLAGSYGLKGFVSHSVAEAKLQALQQAAPGDMIFIGGSTFIVAEAL